ncbi:hypothetical protein XENOCAPTIV_009622, partial [Xenoophorus captivus]
RSLQKLALLLDHYGLNVKDLSPEPKDDLPAALKQPQLDASYIPKKSEDAADKAEKNFLESETGLKVLQSGAEQPNSRWVFATLVSMACIGGILVAAMTIACLRHHAHRLAAKKLGLGPEGGSFTHQEYQAYMEDHLRNKDRLMKEWEALCSYQAEPSSVSVAQSDNNGKKNRCPDSVPCESLQMNES